MILLTTLVSPTIYAGPSCKEIFTSPEESPGTQLSSRFNSDQKPPKSLKFDSTRMISLSRFFGSNFHSKRSHTWDFDGEHFVTKKVSQSLQVDFRVHESLLADMQNFSLQKMVETDYLTPDQAEYFRKLGTRLEPGQIQFVESVRQVSDQELKDNYPGRHNNRSWDDSHSYARFQEPSYVKTAALWSVAGQLWSEAGKPRKLELPWEREEARAGQALDRQKIEYVWEWGRAAQDVSGEVAALYSVNAAVNYIELRAHGGSLDKAYVMAHSFDKVNSRLFSRYHPGSLYPTHWKDMSDALFLIPLREAIEKYPPRKFSKKVDQIIKLSGEKLSNIDALDLLISNRWARWQELTLRLGGEEQTTPIVLNDMSLARAMILSLTVARYPIKQTEKQAIFDYLVGINPSLHSNNYNGKYNNAVDSIRTSFVYGERNGVEVSNLDPELATKNPDYTLIVLYSSLVYQARIMASALQRTYKVEWSEAYKMAIGELQKKEVTFGISTGSSVISEQAKLLGPEFSTQVERTQVDGEVARANLELTPWWYKDQSLHFFSVNRILDLIAARHDLRANADVAEALTPGTWQSQYLLTQPDLF